MEVIVALRIEEVTPLFAVLSAVVNFTSTSTIGIRLVTVCSVVTEAALLWAVLPADWTNAREASLTFFIAEGTVLLHTIGAIRERFSLGTTSSFLPARVGDVGVMVISLEVVDGSTIVIFLSVSQRLLRVMSELGNVFLVIIWVKMRSSDHWVIVSTMESTMVKRAIIEMLLIIVGVMMPFMSSSSRLVIT